MKASTAFNILRSQGASASQIVAFAKSHDVSDMGSEDELLLAFLEMDSPVQPAGPFPSEAKVIPAKESPEREQMKREDRKERTKLTNAADNGHTFGSDVSDVLISDYIAQADAQKAPKWALTKAQRGMLSLAGHLTFAEFAEQNPAFAGILTEANSKLANGGTRSATNASVHAELRKHGNTLRKLQEALPSGKVVNLALLNDPATGRVLVGFKSNLSLYLKGEISLEEIETRQPGR